MNCMEILKLVDQFIDSDLDKETTSAIEKHLAVCPQCRVKFDEALELKALLQSLPQEELPEGFNEELRAKLEEASAEIYGSKVRLLRRPAFRSVVAAAAAVFVFAAAGFAAKYYTGMLGGMKAQSKDAGYANKERSSNEMMSLTIDEDDSDYAKTGAPETTFGATGRGEYEPTASPAPTISPTAGPTTTIGLTLAAAAHRNIIEITVQVSEPDAQLSITRDFAISNNVSVSKSVGENEGSGAANTISFSVNKAGYLILSEHLVNSYSVANVYFVNSDIIDRVTDDSEEITVIIRFE